MILTPRWKSIALSSALALGLVGGSAATMSAMTPLADPRDPAPEAQEKAKPPALQPGDVEPPLVVRDGAIAFDPPPGFFDLPAPNKGDGTDPPTIKAGQIVLVEVLIALPGRPITGERVVRPDGTISLGFYGDLRVVGLNRLQAKVKAIELLRKFLNDEILGLAHVNPKTGKYVLVNPVDSDRLYIDESINYLPGSSRHPATGDPDSAAVLGRMAELEAKLDAILKELKGLKAAAR